jgi:hypothetical protein
MTIAFTVYFIPSGEEEFADGSIYKMQDDATARQSPATSVRHATRRSPCWSGR